MPSSGHAHVPAASAAQGRPFGDGDRTLTPTELNRLRWRCRRGMLENDLILTRFLDAMAGALTMTQAAALDRLLALTDNELWDLVSARSEPEDVDLVPLVAALRAA